MNHKEEDERNFTSASVTLPLKLKIISDPITGLPVLDAGANAPTLTSKEVCELLVDFP